MIKILGIFLLNWEKLSVCGGFSSTAVIKSPNEDLQARGEKREARNETYFTV